MAAAAECIVEVMAAEGTVVDPSDLIVTTGGQQVIDLVCKALVDPGDTIIAEAPTYPGAVPTFGAYQADVVQIEMDADGMPIDELERTLDRLHVQGRRPKFIYTIPNFHNPAGVTMSLARRRRLIEMARERELLVLEDNPYGLLRYEGEALPTLYSLDASDGSDGTTLRPRHLPRHVLEDPRPGPAARLGGRAETGAGEAQPRQTGRRPVQLTGHAAVRGGVLCGAQSRRGPAGWITGAPEEPVPTPARRDAGALAEHFGERATWTRPQGGLFIWATLEDDVDTTDLLARSQTVAFVPGRSAYMDGRSGSTSMRLNFAGVPDEDIREGIRRIGAIMGSDTGLFGSLTGTPPAGQGAGTGQSESQTPPGQTGPGLADVLERPAQAGRSAGRAQVRRRAARSMSAEASLRDAGTAGEPSAKQTRRVAVLKGEARSSDPYRCARGRARRAR